VTGVQTCALPILDRLCQALEMIQSGKDLSGSSSFGADLAALADVYNAAPSAIGGSHWNAFFHPSYSGNGGTLNLKDQIGSQTLVVSRDRRGALYNGMWMRLCENDAAVLLFDVVHSPSGYQLQVSSEDIECRISLGENPIGFEWAAPADVLSFVPEWLAGGMGAAAPSSAPSSSAMPSSAPPSSAPHTAAPAAEASLPAATAPAPAAPVQAASLSQQPTLIRPASEMALILESNGQRLPLLGPLIIGRDKENTLYLEDNEVSRKHAVIEPMPGGWQLRDLNSFNGTWLNGERIHAPTRLTEGDVILFGKTRMRVEKRQG
jgi:hypothetical protein